MTTERLRIATRKSPLALWQAEHVRARLREAHPGLQVELVTMTTQGDRVLDSPLARIGGKGLFVKELEPAWKSAQYSSVRIHSMPSSQTATARSTPCRRPPSSAPPACVVSASCAHGVPTCSCSICVAM